MAEIPHNTVVTSEAATSHDTPLATAPARAWSGSKVENVGGGAGVPFAGVAVVLGGAMVVVGGSVVTGSAVVLTEALVEGAAVVVGPVLAAVLATQACAVGSHAIKLRFAVIPQDSAKHPRPSRDPS
jgi:hypothetical protein